MDCNNYSYVNYASGKDGTIAQSNDDNMVYLELVWNWFNEKYYYVDSVLGDFEPKTFSADPDGYKKAIEYYNSLVQEPDMIHI